MASSIEYPAARSVFSPRKTGTIVGCVFLFSLALAPFAAAPENENAAMSVSCIGGEVSLSSDYQISDRIHLFLSSADQSSADYEVTGPAFPNFDIGYEAAASYWELLD